MVVIVSMKLESFLNWYRFIVHFDSGILSSAIKVSKPGGYCLNFPIALELDKRFNNTVIWEPANIQSDTIIPTSNLAAFGLNNISR